MKNTLIAAFILLFATVGNARERLILSPGTSVKLIECGIVSGDYAQIDILSLTDGTLVLRTLDRIGSLETFKLPRSEWNAKQILVPCRKDVDNNCGDLVEQSENQWVYQLHGVAGAAIGYCR